MLKNLLGSLSILLMLVTPICAAALPDSLLEALQEEKMTTEDIAVLIQDVESDKPLLAHNINKPLNPASVMKLVTTYSALQILGPDYSWKTEFYLDGTLKNGTLFGDLVIKGYGDPYLLDETLLVLVRELRDRGLRDITGNLVIDNSYFQLTETDPGAFDNRPHRVYNAIPSALMYNFQATVFSIQSHPNGRQVDVVAYPKTADVRIDNRMRLVNKPCRGKYRWPSMTFQQQHQGYTVRFSGNYSSKCGPHPISRTASSPEQLFYGAFSSHWKNAGGMLAGRVLTGHVREGSKPFYVHKSRPLADIIRLVNKHSNNVMTRQLLLTLGAEMKGAPATLEKGRQAIQEWMQQQNIRHDHLVVDNGSGLSRDARVTAVTLLDLLQHVWRSPFMPELVSSMSILGIDGTAKKRFRNQPLQGSMHLKTGVIDHVRAMAGVFHGNNGKRYIVISLHNHPDIHNGQGTMIQNELLEWLDTRLDTLYQVSHRH
jgi:D-alanyl-D-alanine carboxypeptidase/D-alanyl-D-alanine-endopeptidase (penicillin-binding protein 4)